MLCPTLEFMRCTIVFTYHPMRNEELSWGTTVMQHEHVLIVGHRVKKGRPPTAADQQVVVGGSVLTGTCPSATNVDVDDSIGGNTVCAISGTITGELTLTDDVIYRLSGTVNVGYWHRCPI